jgi:serine acetyltransferase
VIKIFIKVLKNIPYILQSTIINYRLGNYFLPKFPFFPLIVTSRIRFYKEGKAIIETQPGSYLRLGYGSGGVSSFSYTGINLELYDNATLKIHGSSMLGYGSSICIYKNATLDIGNHVYIASNAIIKCTNFISIGNDCAISWNVTIMDSDFHPWQHNGVEKEINRNIIIKDSVWIGSNVIILKGVSIGRGCIIGAGSVVRESIPDNCLVIGNPAKIVKNNVSWK